MKKKSFWLKITIVMCFYSVLPTFAQQDNQVYFDVDAENFYTSNMLKLDSVRILNSTEKEHLRSWFVRFLSNSADLKESFLYALSKTTQYLPYYEGLYPNHIHSRTTQLTYADYRTMQTEYHQKEDTCFVSFLPVIRGKNTRIALSEMAYIANDSLFRQKKAEIKSQYKKQKTNFLMRHFKTGANYAMALRLTKSLQLSESQITEILQKAENLVEQTVVTPNIDCWKHERENLVVILDEKQYDHFLFLKNMPRSLEQAKEDWKEIRNKGLDVGLDSVSVIRQIANYKAERGKLFDMYAYDDRNKYTAIAADYYRNFCPAIMRKLAEVRNNTTNSKNYQDSYAW